MLLLAVKLVLVPLLIATATLIGRRWGHGVSGWVAAFPLTSGPLSIIFAVQYGSAFASQAALGTLAGILSVSIFCLVYCALAPRLYWFVCIALAVGAFFAMTIVLNALVLSLLPVYLVVLAALTLTRRMIPKPETDFEKLTPPKWDIPARMVTAVVFILVLSYASEHLGAQLSGLLSPFPIFATILAVFAHSHYGANASILTLRGILTGLYAFSTFFLVVGATITVLPLWWTYVFALVAALGVNLFTVRFVRR